MIGGLAIIGGFWLFYCKFLIGIEVGFKTFKAADFKGELKF